MNTEKIWENLAESIRIEKDGTTIPVPVEDIRALLEDRNAGSNAKECTGGSEVAVSWTEGLVLHEGDADWHAWDPEIYGEVAD